MDPATNDRPRPWRVLHVEHHPRIGVPLSLTSGLWRLRHPDLVVVDMPAPSARRYLDRLAERVHRDRALRAGDHVDGLHERFRFGLVAVEDEDLRVALGRSDAARPRDPRCPLLQLVWPDLCGTLPWEAGYAPAAAGLRQPLLGRWPRRRARTPP